MNNTYNIYTKQYKLIKNIIEKLSNNQNIELIPNKITND